MRILFALLLMGLLFAQYDANWTTYPKNEVVEVEWINHTAVWWMCIDNYCAPPFCDGFFWREGFWYCELR
jgi:hypothetical protein